MRQHAVERFGKISADQYNCVLVHTENDIFTIELWVLLNVNINFCIYQKRRKKNEHNKKK